LDLIFKIMESGSEKSCVVHNGDFMSYLKEKAQCNYQMAVLAVENKCYDVAVSRFYYYVYQYVMEFLYLKGEITEKSAGYNHKTTINEFIRQTRQPDQYELNRSLMKIHHLRKQRNTSDYDRNQMIQNNIVFYNSYRCDFNEVRETLKNLNIIEEQSEPNS